MQLTGNNVGKTTVLKLIDFCLGADKTTIYTDTENKKEEYILVKDFLINNNVLVTLLLGEGLHINDTGDILVERNFLTGNKSIRRINGKQYAEKDFETKLLELIIPEHKGEEKPTFRQIISHNIRYRDENINNTLKTLNHFTTDIEYETLYLFLLGCPFDKGAQKQVITKKIKQEKVYKERLEKTQTKNAYEIALSMIEEDIEKLNKKKSSLNINENFEKDIQELNNIKYGINKSSAIVSKLEIRKDLIIEAKKELEENVSNIDINQLRLIYNQAKSNIEGIQKTFEDMVSYHNNMLLEKIRFIAQDLPRLEEEINDNKLKLKSLLIKEKEFSQRVTKGDSFKEFEQFVIELNEKYREKGEMESILSQIREAEENLDKYQEELDAIEDDLFTDIFEDKLMSQIKKFNRYFSAISEELYGEKYALKYDKTVKKSGEQIFKFSSFNANMSSGKKQGEILCFDLAYTMFADEEGISCLHFLLNDKKELMHDNQLLKVSEFIKNKDIQLVVSILKDKLPEELNSNENIVLRLSQYEKLFRIES
ncbi:DUF2326 domain-containing protein [Acetivibrio cellulolyticus]|uniref:DUF2326 domain-containing protein n=2 Tax=Acetivibrio cellulolyticus TaxID=35830 RepID=UPI001F4746CE|nr:DUF2326 domain-containing protein [Acetivibrio cellulolyticus]